MKGRLVIRIYHELELPLAPSPPNGFVGEVTCPMTRKKAQKTYDKLKRKFDKLNYLLEHGGDVRELDDED